MTNAIGAGQRPASTLSWRADGIHPDRPVGNAITVGIAGGLLGGGAAAGVAGLLRFLHNCKVEDGTATGRIGIGVVIGAALLGAALVGGTVGGLAYRGDMRDLNLDWKPSGPPLPKRSDVPTLPRPTRANGTQVDPDSPEIQRLAGAKVATMKLDHGISGHYGAHGNVRPAPGVGKSMANDIRVPKTLFGSDGYPGWFEPGKFDTLSDALGFAHEVTPVAPIHDDATDYAGVFETDSGYLVVPLIAPMTVNTASLLTHTSGMRTVANAPSGLVAITSATETLQPVGDWFVTKHRAADEARTGRR